MKCLILLELAKANRDDITYWEKQMGIRTPASIFHKVIHAEDSVSNYYSNLSETEQDYWRKQAPVHSEIYLEALNSGHIKFIPDGEGGEYFDLNLYDNSYAAVLNEDGFIIVDDVIYQYKGNALKIIFDGDLQKIERIREINSDFINKEMLVEMKKESSLKSTAVDWSYDWSKDMTDIGYSTWHEFDPNWRGRDQKRIKVWIDGHSEPYGTYSDYCAQYVNCTFIVRAEAQIRNFWGNGCMAAICQALLSVQIGITIMRTIQMTHI